MQENELARLGVFRIPISIPFRQAGGPINVYVIEEDSGILLFDVGIGLERSQAELTEGLARTGHGFHEVNRILISHGHVDHYGAAPWVLDRSGKNIPVLIHEADAGKVLDSGRPLPSMLMRNSLYLSRLGVPPEVLDAMVGAISREAVTGRRLGAVAALGEGDIFRCKHVTLEVLSMPGHTPGLCCLYDREHRLLFSADHLLEHVSPNPLIELKADGEPSSFKPLVSYFRSMERLRTLPIDLVLPGHGTPFSQAGAVIRSLYDFYERRQAKLLAALESGPKTVYEAMQELFASDTSFELFLMLSETLGNLEVLEEKGRILRGSDDAVIRFRPAR